MASLPVGVYSTFNVALRDATDEVGNVSGHCAVIVDAEAWADNQAAFTTFVTALQGIVLGQVISKESGGILTIVNPIAIPASAAAQRENKLLIRYYDAINFEKYTMTIPTVNLPLLVFETDAKDFVSKTQWVGGGTNMSTFVTQFQAFVKAPRTGNAVVIKSLQYVGRNT